MRASMDYNLPSLKLMVAQLKAASRAPKTLSYSLGHLRFQRVWVQGVLVAGPTPQGRLVLDDGSGLIELILTGDAQGQNWSPGMYVLVIGAYLTDSDEPFAIKVHKIVDLSAFPDREALWHLEVIEAHDRFYEGRIQGDT